MSTGITSCCTPVAATPVVAQPQPQLASSGETAPAPIETGTPGTGYDAAAAPVDGGNWIPAPIGGGDEPPAPIDGPRDDASTATPVATGPASQLATWPQWQQHFAALGLGQEEIAKLGAASATDEQLAQIYEQVHAGIVAAGGVPGETPATGDAPTSAWTDKWTQLFTALGLSSEAVEAFRAEAERIGASEAQIAAVYDALLAMRNGTAGTDGTGGTDAGTDASQQPGWNAQVEAAFRELGMPDDVIAIYAQSGAPLSGLEKAYEHAKGRLEDFTERGWLERFQAAGAEPKDYWPLILSAQAPTDKECQTQLDAVKMGKMSGGQWAGQIALSLFPGGQLVQYAIGKDAISDRKIDRSDWGEIGKAALSGLAAFLMIRGGKNVLAGMAARSANYPALAGVGETLAKLGASRTGTEAASQAVVGATTKWGPLQKIAAFVPGTKTHRTIVGMAHVEAAAKAFNEGGAAKILANEVDGAQRLQAIARMFDDVASGKVAAQGGKNAYFAFKRAPIVDLVGEVATKSTGKVGGIFGKKGTSLVSARPVETKRVGFGMNASTVDGPLNEAAADAGSILRFSKKLRVGNGNSQLAAIAQAAGDKYGRAAGVLASEDAIAGLSAGQRSTIGKVWASSTVRDLGLDSFSKDGLRPMMDIKALAQGGTPDWYAELVAGGRSGAASLTGTADENLELAAQVAAMRPRRVAPAAAQTASAAAPTARAAAPTSAAAANDSLLAKLSGIDQVTAGPAPARNLPTFADDPFAAMQHAAQM